MTADSRQVKEGEPFPLPRGGACGWTQIRGLCREAGGESIVASKEVKAAEGVTVVYVADTRKAMEDMVPFFL